MRHIYHGYTETGLLWGGLLLHKVRKIEKKKTTYLHALQFPALVVNVTLKPRETEIRPREGSNKLISE